MPNETEFANSHEEAQLDVERREKNIKHRRTMIDDVEKRNRLCLAEPIN